LKSRREREREREKRKCVGSLTLHLTGRGNRVKFTVMKVSMQCPLALLVKVGWRRGKTFDCKEGRDGKWSKERS
jgi:hypothetical protein